MKIKLMTAKTACPVLLVEDSPEDCEAALRAFKKSGLPSRVYHCADGDDALDFLYGRGAYSDRATSPRPGFIVLDLNLPGTDGRQVLVEIKQDDQLKTIPVVIFTTSDHEEDVEACYQAGANSYIKKPVDLDDFNRALLAIKQYWFDTVLLSGD